MKTIKSNYKSKIAGAIINSFLLCVLFFLIITPNYYETHYKMDCYVIDVQSADNLITVVDVTGNEWQLYAEDVAVDDLVRVTFFDEHTSDRIDDEIVNVKKLSKKC